MRVGVGWWDDVHVVVVIILAVWASAFSEFESEWAEELANSGCFFDWNAFSDDGDTVGIDTT